MSDDTRHTTGTSNRSHASQRETDAVQAFVDGGEISPAQLEEVDLLGAAMAETSPEGPPVDEAPLVVVRERLRHSARPAAEPARGGLADLAARVQWAATPPLARVAMAAQFVLLLGLVVALTLGDDTASDGHQVIAGGMVGDYTLTFAPGVTEAQLRAVLLDSRATIVTGPSAIGLYTIELDPGVDPVEAAERLRASGLVTFLQAAPRP